MSKTKEEKEELDASDINYQAELTKSQEENGKLKHEAEASQRRATEYATKMDDLQRKLELAMAKRPLAILPVEPAELRQLTALCLGRLTAIDGSPHNAKTFSHHLTTLVQQAKAVAMEIADAIPDEDVSKSKAKVA